MALAPLLPFSFCPPCRFLLETPEREAGGNSCSILSQRMTAQTPLALPTQPLRRGRQLGAHTHLHSAILSPPLPVACRWSLLPWAQHLTDTPPAFRATNGASFDQVARPATVSLSRRSPPHRLIPLRTQCWQIRKRRRAHLRLTTQLRQSKQLTKAGRGRRLNEIYWHKRPGDVCVWGVVVCEHWKAKGRMNMRCLLRQKSRHCGACLLRCRIFTAAAGMRRDGGLRRPADGFTVGARARRGRRGRQCVAATARGRVASGFLGDVCAFLRRPRPAGAGGRVVSPAPPGLADYR